MDNHTAKRDYKVFDKGVPLSDTTQVFHQSSSTVPEGAVLLAENDVLDMQYRIISKWKPRLEM